MRPTTRSPLKRGFGNNGYSLVEVAVAMGLIVASTLLIAQIFRAHFSEIKRLNRRVAVGAAQDAIRAVLSQEPLCSCQLNPATNAANAAALRIDTTNSGPQTINLPVVRESCDFVSTSNILAQVGQPLLPADAQVLVQSMTIEGLHPLTQPNEYRGRLTIRLSSAAGSDAFRPVSIPLRIAVDPSLGSPTARPVARCISTVSSAGTALCPTGFKLVGTPGAMTSFCMDAAPRPAKKYFQAYDICQGVQPAGFGRAGLCTIFQALAACQQGELTGGASFEMAGQLYTGSATNISIMASTGITPSTCDAMTAYNDLNTVASPFRCCL